MYQPNMKLVVEENIPEEEEYIVREVNGRFTITTTWMSDESDLKQWVKRVRKIYRHKLRNRTLVIGLCADRSHHYASGSSRDGRKESELPYELLQMCVGTHCLLGYMDGGMNPTALRDFLHEGRATVVGVGLEKLLAKAAKDNGWLAPTRRADLGALAAEALGNDRLRRLGVGRLAWAVLGDHMRLEKPDGIVWYDSKRSSMDLTDDLLKHASAEAFLASQTGEKLLFPTNKPKQ